MSCGSIHIDFEEEMARPLDQAVAGRSLSQVVKQLRNGEPPILISHPDTLPVPTFTGKKDSYDVEESIVIKPQSLKEGDREIVCKRLTEILAV